MTTATRCDDQRNPDDDDCARQNHSGVGRFAQKQDCAESGEHRDGQLRDSRGSDRQFAEGSVPQRYPPADVTAPDTTARQYAASADRVRTWHGRREAQGAPPQKLRAFDTIGSGLLRPAIEYAPHAAPAAAISSTPTVSGR